MMQLASDANLIIVLVSVFSIGFVAGLSPCTLPTVVFVTAYVSGQKDYSKSRGFILSLAFVMGIAVMLSLLGAFAGLISKQLVNTTVLNYFIAFLLILMGLWMLKVINFDGSSMMINRFMPKKNSGIVGAFLLGIPFGIAASPCTLPITASVLAYSATKGSALYGLIIMFFYALGRSIPLLVVGTFTGIIKNVEFFAAYQSKFERIAGVALIFLGLYFIWIA